MVIEMPDLYPHQEKMRDDIRKALFDHRRAILCAPPGTGKTRMAKWIMGSYANRPKSEGQSGFSLFVVHRRGLVDNASTSFGEYPVLPHGIIMSGRDTDFGNAVHVASIDTIKSWYCKGEEYDGHTFDLIVYDECVSGDSIINTDIGPMRIDTVPALKPSTVRSYSQDKGIHFARILNWKHSGYRTTLEVHTHVGTIQCTPDHKIYTRRGWLEAQFVLDTDEILVSVAAANSQSKGNYSGQATSNWQHDNNCPTSSTNSTASHRCVPADAEHKLDLCTTALIRGRSIVAQNSASMRMGMTTATAISCLNSRRWKDKRSSERCLAIHRSVIQTNGRRPHGSVARMVSFRRNGLNTRRRSCVGLVPKLASQKTAAGEKHRFALPRLAIHHSSKLTTSLSGVVKRKPLASGWMQLATSGLRGGYATMGPQAQSHCFCTQRGFQDRGLNSSRSGSVTLLERQVWSGTNPRGCSSLALPAKHKSRSGIESRNSFPNVCDTNWSRVTKIVAANPVDVYDIEVEGSHCFFANNLLVHNCHSHVPALRSFLGPHDARRAKDNFKPAFVMGLSATPQHKELNKVFKTIVKGPTPEWLIENKFLSPFRYFQCTKGDLSKLVKQGDDYTEASVAAAMTNLAGDLVKDWKRLAEGRATVGFFPRRSHAQEAVELLLAAGVRARYVDGETPDDERREMFADLNEGRIDYIANVGVIERGTDIPRIGCVQMCTAVGNVVRWKQMIGRGSRIHKAVDDCIVLDHADGIRKHGFFEDDTEWSLEWGERPAKTNETRATVECPSCGAIYRGGQCRQCGYEPTKKERKSQGLEFIGGELQEVTKKDVKEKKTKTCEELMISALYSAAHGNRTFAAACVLARKAAEKQGTKMRVPAVIEIAGVRYRTIPYGNIDSKLLVKDTYGALLGNLSREANPYRE